MSELSVHLRCALIELRVDGVLNPGAYSGAVDNAVSHIERALAIVETPEPESGPGWVKITGSDTPADVDRKMADAFSPLRAMRWALHPNFRRRGLGGRFLPGGAA